MSIVGLPLTVDTDIKFMLTMSPRVRFRALAQFDRWTNSKTRSTQFEDNLVSVRLRNSDLIRSTFYILLVNCSSCAIWMWNRSPTLREESRLRVFENRILRRIFGPKRDENGEWRRSHNEKLHSLYRSPNIVRVIKSRRLRWAGHVPRMEEGRSAFKILTGKPTGKRPLGRPRRRY